MTLLKEWNKSRSKRETIAKAMGDYFSFKKELNAIDLKISNLYLKLFVNLVSEPIEIGRIKLDFREDRDYIIYLTTYGFAYRVNDTWHLTRIGYNLDILEKIFKEIPNIHQFAKQKNKKELIKIWQKEFKKIKHKQYRVIIKRIFDKNNEIIDNCILTLNHNTLHIQDRKSNFQLCYNEQFLDINFEQWLILEQVYSKAFNLINKKLEDTKKDIILKQKTLDNLKDKCAKWIILKGLKTHKAKDLNSSNI